MERKRKTKNLWMEEECVGCSKEQRNSSLVLFVQTNCLTGSRLESPCYDC